MLHQSQKSVARYNEERLAGVGGREYGGEKAITERMRAKQMVDLSSWVVANQREQGSVRTLQVHREREGEREGEVYQIVLAKCRNIRNPEQTVKLRTCLGKTHLNVN